MRQDREHIGRHDGKKAEKIISWLGIAIFAASTFAILFALMPLTLNMFDESIVLSNALRVLHGQLIHRDFYSIYGPGEYYALAALFHFFGFNFLLARAFDLVVRTTSISLLFLILAEATAFPTALLFAAIAVSLYLVTGFYLYNIFWCLVFSFISILAIVRYSESKWAAAVSGACAGIVALIRYDVGAFLLLANFLSIISSRVLWPTVSGQKRPSLFALLVTHCAGTGLFFIPPAIVFLFSSSIEPFVFDVIRYPTHYYVRMRGLPFPGLSDILNAPIQWLVYLPILAIGLISCRLIRSFIGLGLSNSPTNRYLVALGWFTALFFVKGYVRVSINQMFLAIIMGLVVLAIFCHEWWRNGGYSRLASILIAYAVGLPIGIQTLEFLKQDALSPLALSRAWTTGKTLQEVAGYSYTQNAPWAYVEKDYTKIANFIDLHSAANEPLFSALDRHDKIFVNSVGLYVIAARQPGTHWSQFDPGMQTRADIQSQIVSDLLKHRVHWIVRDGNYSEVREPNESALGGGAHVLDKFIETQYRPITTSGHLSVWLWNGVELKK